MINSKSLLIEDKIIRRIIIIFKKIREDIIFIYNFL